MRPDFLLRRIARHLWREWVRPLAVPLILITAGKSALADINYVPSGSMHPTLLEGDVVFVNKLAYDFRVPFTFTRLARWSEPARGDIVVCFEPNDGTRLVKRVIGLPGDTLELRNHALYVNGIRQAYRLLDASVGRDLPANEQNASMFAREELGEATHTVMAARWPTPSANFGPVTLPAGSYFMLGDNRDNSRDSRYFGFMPREKIIGRVNNVVVSADTRNWLKPRFERWFSKLD